MLHLFNSCYVYPDILFDPSSNYIFVGKNAKLYSTGVNGSFYYNNVVVKSCLGVYDTYEEFMSSNMVLPALYNKEKIVIYADGESLLKFFTASLRAQVDKITPEFYSEMRGLFAARLNAVSSILVSEAAKKSLVEISELFLDYNHIPVTTDFPTSREWNRANCGIEWKIIRGDYSSIPSFINRYVYSYYEEARINYLSRKPAENSWALNPVYSSYNTVPSMAELYHHIRKEVFIILDDIILDFYQNNDIDKVIGDRRFLLLFASNKDLYQKFDIWVMRWMMKKSKEELKQLGVL